MISGKRSQAAKPRLKYQDLQFRLRRLSPRPAGGREGLASLRNPSGRTGECRPGRPERERVGEGRATQGGGRSGGGRKSCLSWRG